MQSAWAEILMSSASPESETSETVIGGGAYLLHEYPEWDLSKSMHAELVVHQQDRHRIRIRMVRIRVACDTEMGEGFSFLRQGVRLSDLSDLLLWIYCMGDFNNHIEANLRVVAETANSYEDLFHFRGAPYDRAMSLFPDARREEFLNTIQRADLNAGQSVGDVPAGGGYLASYLPDAVRWLGHEPCASFGLGGADQELLPLPWTDSSVDAAISIAGVHHLADKRPLFAELARTLRDGGRLVLADVHEASAVSRFLDGWVDHHNSTGHEGVYLGDHTLDDLRGTGWQILSAERVPFHWRFADTTDMGKFCNLMFDLRNCQPCDTASAIEANLGVDRLVGGVGMRWELFMIVATRAPRL